MELLYGMGARGVWLFGSLAREELHEGSGLELSAISWKASASI